MKLLEHLGNRTNDEDDLTNLGHEHENIAFVTS